MFCKTIFLKIKLMKTIKMCLKCRLLFIILCFREPDEHKIEVEDKRGIKRRKEEFGVFILSKSTKSRVFYLIRKQGKHHKTVFSFIYKMLKIVNSFSLFSKFVFVLFS